jgi:hypothetical protein
VKRIMSRTTVHYIQLPKLKSLLTSCRRAKARCETLLFKTKPRRRDEEKRFNKEPPAPRTK